jgi:hypothetical protein
MSDQIRPRRRPQFEQASRETVQPPTSPNDEAQAREPVPAPRSLPTAVLLALGISLVAVLLNSPVGWFIYSWTFNLTGDSDLRLFGTFALFSLVLVRLWVLLLRRSPVVRSIYYWTFDNPTRSRSAVSVSLAFMVLALRDSPIVRSIEISIHGNSDWSRSTASVSLALSIFLGLFPLVFVLRQAPIVRSMGNWTVGNLTRNKRAAAVSLALGIFALCPLLLVLRHSRSVAPMLNRSSVATNSPATEPVTDPQASTASAPQQDDRASGILGRLRKESNIDASTTQAAEAEEAVTPEPQEPETAQPTAVTSDPTETTAVASEEEASPTVSPEDEAYDRAVKRLQEINKEAQSVTKADIYNGGLGQIEKLARMLEVRALAEQEVQRLDRARHQKRQSEAREAAPSRTSPRRQRGPNDKTCANCQGERTEFCQPCGGDGVLMVISGQQIYCTYCRGAGKATCWVCKGTGVYDAEAEKAKNAAAHPGQKPCPRRCVGGKIRHLPRNGSPGSWKFCYTCYGDGWVDN